MTACKPRDGLSEQGGLLPGRALLSCDRADRFKTAGTARLFFLHRPAMPGFATKGQSLSDPSHIIVPDDHLALDSLLLRRVKQAIDPSAMKALLLLDCSWNNRFISFKDADNILS